MQTMLLVYRNKTKQQKKNENKKHLTINLIILNNELIN